MSLESTLTVQLTIGILAVMTAGVTLMTAITVLLAASRFREGQQKHNHE